MRRFIPTGAYELLRSIRATWPTHTLLLADFSALPPSTAAGASLATNAPLVASDGGNIDHAHYTDVPGQADIFFPTDFEWLAAAYMELGQRVSERHNVVASGPPTEEKICEVMPSKAFLTAHGEQEHTRCVTMRQIRHHHPVIARKLSR